jgi:formylglycine-generating enzyme required for sulfatase activity
MGSPVHERRRGTDEVQHTATICMPFAMSVTPVTRSQFSVFAADAGYVTEAERDGWAYSWDGAAWTVVQGITWRKPGISQGDDHPVVCVSWQDAYAFCLWASRERLAVRLPTEAEWEYACRAGTVTPYYWGGEWDTSRVIAACCDDTGRMQRCGTEGVKGHPPNPWGLYDMLGNVWEWCHDGYAAYLESAAAKATSANQVLKRVMRGGSWLGGADVCRCAFRGKGSATRRNPHIGFRVCFTAGCTAIEGGSCDDL